VAETVTTPPDSRRRTDLALRRAPDGSIAIGFHARGSAEVLDLRECHILDPALFALLAPLRVVLRRLSALSREGSAVVNLLDSGPDILLRTDKALDATGRRLLAAFAQPVAAQSGGLKLHVPSPDWRDQVIYFVLTDRFDDGNPRNNEQGLGEYNPREGHMYSGGDIEGSLAPVVLGRTDEAVIVEVFGDGEASLVVEAGCGDGG
jgi:hypothetical protein